MSIIFIFLSKGATKSQLFLVASSKRSHVKSIHLNTNFTTCRAHAEPMTRRTKANKYFAAVKIYCTVWKTLNWNSMSHWMPRFVQVHLSHAPGYLQQQFDSWTQQSARYTILPAMHWCNCRLYCASVQDLHEGNNQQQFSVQASLTKILRGRLSGFISMFSGFSRHQEDYT